MAQAVPLAKIATLLVKTLAKPVSKRIKKEFEFSPYGRKMLIGIGQTTNSVTSRMTIWSEGYTVKHIKELPEEKALTTGADFVGESFILLVSVSTVIWEYNRSNNKAQAKEEKLRAAAKAERDALQANFLILEERIQELEEVVRYNSESILNVTGKRLKDPNKRKQLVDVSYEKDAKLLEVLHVKQSTKKNGKGTSDADNQIKAQIEVQQPETNSTIETAPKEEANDNNTPWWKFW